MIIENLKRGYPYYRSRENDAAFENCVIACILKLDDKRIWRIYIEDIKNKEKLPTFVELSYQDCVYLTKDEYDHKDILDSEWPGGEIYAENDDYWNSHKKEFMTIKLKAFLYRVKRKIELFLYRH